MHRYLAVHIQHPRISYAALFRLDRPHRRSRQLVTLREKQSEATVELYLLEERRGEKAKPEKLLHTFWLRNLPARSAGRTQITVEARYDGRGKADIAVLVAGEVRDRVSLRVPRESKATRRLAAVGAVLLLLLGSFGVWRRLTPGSGGSGGEAARGSAAVAEKQLDEGSSAGAAGQLDGGSSAEAAGQLDGAEDASDRMAEAADEGATSGVARGSPGPGQSPSADETPRVQDEPGIPGRDGDGSGSGGSSAAAADAAGAADAASTAGAAGAADEPTEPPVKEPPPSQEFVAYFAPDQTALSSEARSRLAEVAELLRESSEAEVRIVGHTALYGTEEGRIEISRGRAQNVYEYLIAQGWEPRERPTVAWEASTDPVTLDSDAQELNRRVEIEVGSETLSQ